MKTYNKYGFDEEQKEMFADSVEAFMLRLKRDPDRSKSWRQLAYESSKKQHHEKKRTRRNPKKEKGETERDRQTGRGKRRKHVRLV